MSKPFGELAIGDQFMFSDGLYEKITPIKVSCCRSVTAKKLADNTNVLIRNHIPVEPVEKE